MKPKVTASLIGRIIIVAQLIAFLISLIPYFEILQSMREPEVSQLMDLAKWLEGFVIGQFFGWPISLIANGLLEFGKAKRGR